MPLPTALIVHAHPEPLSFSSAQAALAGERLRGRGFAVETIDLYARGWAPVLDRDEFMNPDSPFKPQAEQLKAVRQNSLAPEVRADLDRLLAADLLVLSFPLWWFSMPAVLKGWVDRVFVMGATFGGEFGLFDAAALAGKRAVLLITTGGSVESFRSGGTFGAVEDFLFHIHRGMLEFVGYTTLPPILTYGPAHMDAEEREAALGRVRDAIDRVSLAHPDTVRG